MNIGDTVVLKVPENPRLHGTYATVESVTPWGAHVLARSAATGRFRALHQEMTPRTATGECCSNCGGVNLVRSGTCAVCSDCGSTSGCS